MRRPREQGRRAVAVLATAAFLLGFVATPEAASQTGEDTGTGQADVEQFGGYIAAARSNAIQVTYDSPGLLPTGGAAILQVSVPESLANLNTGPVGFARSSFVFPGPLIADFGSALEQTGTEGVPTYPVRTEAFFPSGPTSTKSGDAGTQTTADTEFGNSRAAGSYAGTVVPGLLGVGGVTAVSQTTIEGTELVSRTRTELTDVQLLGGVVGIDSIVTDLIAKSNGTDAATGGGTTVSGITVLGLRAELSGQGLRLVDPLPTPDDSGPARPVTDLLGTVTGGATDDALDQLRTQLQPLLDELNTILATAGDEALTGLDPVLDLFGIEFNLLDAAETKSSGTADRIANGLGIKITYDGGNTPVITDLLDAVPDGILPNDNLGPIPLSPASIFAILKELSIINIALAPGNVSVAATPAFEVDVPGFVPAAPSDVPSSSSVGTAPTPGDFASAAPSLATPPADSGSTVPTVPASNDDGFPFGDALPLILVLMMLFTTPLWSALATRLADNALVPPAGSCPEGLDAPSIPEDGP